MLKKMVNGIEIICSSKEEAQIRAEWAENARSRTPAELDTIKDAQIEREFPPSVVTMYKTVIPLIDASLIVDEIIAIAKTNRKSEL